jgi:hypothetical protein
MSIIMQKLEGIIVLVDRLHPSNDIQWQIVVLKPLASYSSGHFPKLSLITVPQSRM